MVGRVVLGACLLACGSNESERAGPTPEPPRPPARIVPARATPAFEVPPPAEKIRAIGRGDRHACVVRESGVVDCWGQPWQCKEDCSTRPPPDHRVRRVPGVTDAIAISGNGRCVLRETREVACLAPEKLELVPIAGLTDVTAMSHSGNCFVHGKGAVACITDITTNELRSVPGITDAVSVSSTTMMMGCALRKSGEAMCGFLGEGPWRRLQGVPKLRDILLTGDRIHVACVMSERGDADCFELWPYADKALEPVRGEAGNGTRLLAPEQFRNASELSLQSLAGPYESQELRLEGVVGGKVVWSDVRGASGTVPLLADVAHHTGGCAIRSGGSVVCWGAK